MRFYAPLLATSPPGFAQAGLLYSLHGKAGRQGSRFYDSIKVSVLNKGAKRVAANIQAIPMHHAFK